MLVAYLLVGLFGAIIGSFLNVLIIRLYKGITIMGRSECPHCRTTLRPQHLVPVLSWIWLRGRCATCQYSIHIQYPLVEITSAAIFVVVYLRHPLLTDPSLWPVFAVESIFLLLLLALTVFDLRWKVLPIEPMIIGTVLVATWKVMSGTLPWMSVLIGMVVGGGFLGAQVWLSRGRAMGGGDPWLGLLMGAFLGWPQVGVALYFTYVVGGGIILVLYLLGMVRKGSRIPFAPFLVLGTLGAMVYGQAMEIWIRRLF